MTERDRERQRETERDRERQRETEREIVRDSKSDLDSIRNSCDVFFYNWGRFFMNILYI